MVEPVSSNVATSSGDGDLVVVVGQRPADVAGIAGCSVVSREFVVGLHIRAPFGPPATVGFVPAMTATAGGGCDTEGVVDRLELSPEARCRPAQ